MEQQLWPKVLAPLDFYQKIHHFSQKIIAIYMCFFIYIYVLCVHWINTKTEGKK